MQFHPLQIITGIIDNKYKIYKQITFNGKSSLNHLYLINPIDFPNNFCVLKNYINHQGFKTQVNIFKEFNLYGNYLIDSSQNYQYSQSSVIHYAILENAQASSINDFLKYVIKLPSRIARQFIKKVLQSLIYIKKKFNIIHPWLNPADIILLNNKSVIVSGWSKQNKSTERQIIFDIGQLLFSMIVGTRVPSNTFGDDKYKRQKFSFKEWQATKKNLAKQKIQPPQQGLKPIPIQFPNCLLNFFQICLISQKYDKITLQDLLKHQYLSNQFCQPLTAQQVKLQLQKIQKFYTQKRNKQMIDRFAIKKNSKQYHNIGQLALSNHFDDDQPNRDFQLGGFIRDYFDFQEQIQSVYSQKQSLNQTYNQQKNKIKFQPQQINNFMGLIDTSNKQKIIHLKSSKISRYPDKDIQLSKKISNESEYYQLKNLKKQSKKSKISLTLLKKKSKLIDKLSFMLMWIQNYLVQNKGNSLVFPQNYVRLCGLGLMDDKFIKILKKTQKQLVFKLKLQFQNYSNYDVDFNQLQQNWPDPLIQTIILQVTIYLPYKDQNNIKIQTLQSKCHKFYTIKLQSLIYDQIKISMKKN